VAWAITKMYTSKCVQMDPQQLPKTSKQNFIPDAKGVTCKTP